MEIEVSVITPAYNASKTILDTYESIKNQTFSNWEWIVADDCSKDDTLKILRDLANKDPRIVIVESNENGGAAKSRNLAIEKARGRYLAFLDADDLWLPTKLEEQLEFMKANNYAFTYTNYDVFLPNGKVINYSYKKNYSDYKDILKGSKIGCLTVIIDTSITGKIFMPLDAEKREDHAAWLDLTKRGIIAYKLDKTLCKYRIGNTSVSHNKFKLIKYQYRMYRRHEKFGVFKSWHYTFMVIFNKVFRKYIY